MTSMKVYGVWSYDKALEPKLVQKFTTTLVESVAEERAIWDYAQQQRGKYFAVVRESFPQTDPPTRVILSVHTVRAEEARSESRA